MKYITLCIDIEYGRMNYGDIHKICPNNKLDEDEYWTKQICVQDK